MVSEVDILTISSEIYADQIAKHENPTATYEDRIEEKI